MTYVEYSMSLKTPNYDRTKISNENKYLIDKMIDENIPFELIAQSINLPLYLIKDYYNNEWCYKNPEKYFHSTWVAWVNTYIKHENKSKTK